MQGKSKIVTHIHYTDSGVEKVSTFLKPKKANDFAEALDKFGTTYRVVQEDRVAYDARTAK